MQKFWKEIALVKYDADIKTGGNHFLECVIDI